MDRLDQISLSGRRRVRHAPLGARRPLPLGQRPVLLEMVGCQPRIRAIGTLRSYARQEIGEVREIRVGEVADGLGHHGLGADTGAGAVVLQRLHRVGLVLAGETRHLFAAGVVGVVAPGALALGGEIKVPLVSGERENLKVPEGTTTGSLFRVRGKGIADVSGRGRGDLLVTVQAITPRKLSKEQRKLLEQLAATLPPQDFEPTPREEEERGLFDKVKDIFG